MVELIMKKITTIRFSTNQTIFEKYKYVTIKQIRVK